jgi:phosphoenolpyruvate carboxykinase (GTP)
MQWMLGRIEGTASGTDNIFGVSPNYGDLNWSGMDFSQAQFDSVIGIDHAAWQHELTLHTELFNQLAYHLPAELVATKQALEQRLAA